MALKNKLKHPNTRMVCTAVEMHALIVKLIACFFKTLNNSLFKIAGDIPKITRGPIHITREASGIPLAKGEKLDLLD